MQGIDSQGLDGQDRKYLETIVRVFHGGPVGVEAVAHTMNLAIDTLVDEVEPYLLRSGLVVRTPRGRKITASGYEHLGIAPRPVGGPAAAAVLSARRAARLPAGQFLGQMSIQRTRSVTPRASWSTDGQKLFQRALQE